MAKCSNWLLSKKNFVTYGALYAVSQTTFGTCCIFADNCLFGVAECRNCLLSNKYFVTYGALYAVSQTTLGTCCIFAVNCLFGVACCFDCDCFARKFGLANCTVNNIVVGAINCTCWSNVVFYNSSDRSVACCIFS